jgi:UDP:flavonoid glycosyltransferase YjiC (YdhE family)
VITHAGLNTVLESLAEGVPLVALPLGNDQPGVASRVRARGAAVVIPQQKLTAGKLRTALETVLENPAYRDSARRLQAVFQQVDGLERAADIIEQAFGIGAQRPGAWKDSIAAD